MTTLYLLRHAESTPDPDIPEPHWPLSKDGQEQAASLVDRLSPLGIGKIFSSPFERALATSRPFAQAAGIEIQIVEDLKERRLGPTKFLGDRFHDIMNHLWADLDNALEGGESGYDCQTRVADAIRLIASQNPSETILISSHGQALTLFLNAIDENIGCEFWSEMKNPDLFRVEVSTEGEMDYKSLTPP